MRARVVQESDRAAAVLTIVAAGQAASLFPSSISKLPHAGVQFRPIEGGQPTLEHCFVYRASPLNPTLSDFIRLLRRFSGSL
jgi:DNA-binding transcriptional LysR family regulator